MRACMCTLSHTCHDTTNKKPARGSAVVDEVEGEDGRFDGALRQADGVCYAAHAARYGALPPALYRKLLAAAEEAEAADAGWEDEDEYEEDDDDGVIQIQ